MLRITHPRGRPANQWLRPRESGGPGAKIAGAEATGARSSTAAGAQVAGGPITVVPLKKGT
ncbi:MAG: hypothetical protein KA383_14465 [Phycisphaerae bacterium]|nr:hypothetical protein [Phycisphaerae bacterium]